MLGVEITSRLPLEYLIKEIGRGDFDGDGNEDALIEIAWHTEGTLGGCYSEVVTKTGAGLKLKWVEIK